jgi:tripartite-type tricarboxylate transporter receptor subunit TctC
MRRRDFIAGCLGLPLAAQAGAARAESGPLTRIIFPFAAGGGGDTLCRIVAQHLGELLDRTVIVENRTGGDGLIGIRAVKGAKPDGATILVTTGPTMYLLPMVETAPSYDTAKDFVPVSLLARFEFGIVLGPAVEAKTFAEFVTWLKTHPDRATFGVPSNGTIPHFTGSRLQEVLGVSMTRVPYRGQRADHQRSRRRPSAVWHHHDRRCDPAISRGRCEDPHREQCCALAVPSGGADVEGERRRPCR